MSYRYDGKVKIELCQRLVKGWRNLADYFEIPVSERSQFEKGYECQEVWEWLEGKDKLQELPEALQFIGHDDLSSLLKKTESENKKGNHPDDKPKLPPNRKKLSKTVIGQNQRDLLIWLRDEWMPDGSTVCFVEGFSGVGKTQVARALLESMEVIGTTAVKVDMPDMETNSIDDLLLDLAGDLELNNYHQLVDAIDKGQDLLKAFEKLLFSNPVLIIIDEFQRALMPGSATPIKKFAGFLERLGRRPQQQGRLLLLSNRSMERGRWLETHKVRTLSGLTPTEAEQLLGDLLAERADEVPLARRREVVNALACNPRALHVFVECLRREPLNDLLGAIPDLWSVDDREISADLLYRLEKALLERTLVHINEEVRLFLENIVVYRKSIKQKAFKKMANSTAKAAQCRNELIDRFLLELHKDWYSLNPVVREIVLHSMNEQALRRAHSLAADYYARHFLSQQVVKTGGSGELGGHFVEARFHLVRAKREDVLQKISARFEQYLRATIDRVSRPPQNETELNERIALLSGLLKHGGMKGWEYHLARCYRARGASGDIEKALQHLRKATGSHAPADTWLLRVSLEDEIHGVDKALIVTKEGIRQISVDKELRMLYHSCGELLARDNRIDEAINLLREGIQNIPADKSLAHLYQSCGELLARAARPQEAIEWLRKGMQAIPVGKWNREYLVNSAFYLSVAEQDIQTIEQILAGQGKDAVEPRPIALGQLLRLQLQEQWQEAAKVAQTAREKFPTDIELATQESFSWLCAGEAKTAQQALERFPKEFPDKERHPVRWLQAFIALKQQNQEAAQKFLAIYLNQSLNSDEPINERLLLRLWDEDAMRGGFHPAYYFPHLPPSLTGLPQTVTRKQYGSSALEGF